MRPLLGNAAPLGPLQLAYAVLLERTARVPSTSRHPKAAVPPLLRSPWCNFHTGSFWPDAYSSSEVSLVCSLRESRELLNVELPDCLMAIMTAISGK